MSKLHDTLERYLDTKKIDPELKDYALTEMENEIVREIIEQKAVELIMLCISCNENVQRRNVTKK